MKSMNWAARALEQSFFWLTLDDAKEVVNAYTWATYAERERLISDLDVARMKAIILAWLAQSAAEVAQDAVMRELNQAAIS